MQISEIVLGLEVVRSVGDYVVGRVGTIVGIDSAKNRAQVEWNEGPNSWVAFTSIEPTSTPYEILEPKQKDKYRWTNPKYVRK